MLQACLAVEQQLTEKGKNNIAFCKGASFDLSIRKNCILKIRCSLSLLVSNVCFDICGGIERASLPPKILPSI